MKSTNAHINISKISVPLFLLFSPVFNGSRGEYSGPVLNEDDDDDGGVFVYCGGVDENELL